MLRQGRACARGGGYGISNHQKSPANRYNVTQHSSARVVRAVLTAKSHRTKKHMRNWPVDEGRAPHPYVMGFRRFLNRPVDRPSPTPDTKSGVQRTLGVVEEKRYLCGHLRDRTPLARPQPPFWANSSKDPTDFKGGVISNHSSAPCLCCSMGLCQERGAPIPFEGFVAVLWSCGWRSPGAKGRAGWMGGQRANGQPQQTSEWCDPSKWDQRTALQCNGGL